MSVSRRGPKVGRRGPKVGERILRRPQTASTTAVSPQRSSEALPTLRKAELDPAVALLGVGVRGRVGRRSGGLARIFSEAGQVG